MPTLAGTQDVLDLISPQIADAFQSSAAIIERHLTKAERDVVAETRRDWVDSYVSVNDNVKETLRTATANKTAMELTNKYKAFEFSRAAAITSLNVFHNEMSRAIRVLSDLDTTDIRGVN